MKAIETRTRATRALTALAVGVLTALLGGCVREGVAEGTAETPSGEEETVVFDWNTDRGDRTRGDISVTTPGGKRFAGTYFEITEEVDSENLGPLWDGWAVGWDDWGMPGYGGGEFTTLYSGKVVATLRGPGTDSMRCRFTLARPEQGLSGGGTGECQTKSGIAIDNAVLERE